MAGDIPNKELWIIFVVEIVSLNIDTEEKYREKSQIGLCVFLGHPSVHSPSYHKCLQQTECTILGSKFTNCAQIYFKVKHFTTVSHRTLFFAFIKALNKGLL